MASLSRLFGKKKEKEKEEKDVLKYRLYKLIVFLATRPFQQSSLKWYEFVTMVVVGVLCGIGFGILIHNLLFPKHREMIIVLNETHIVRVK